MYNWNRNDSWVHSTVFFVTGRQTVSDSVVQKGIIYLLDNSLKMTFTVQTQNIVTPADKYLPYKVFGDIKSETTSMVARW